MTRRSDPRALGAALLVAALASATGCAREVSIQTDVGHHRVRLRVPPGWERLDHGREQIFRNGDARVVLEDEGPASREGIRRELRRAKEAWTAGRRKDAVAIVHRLGGPAIENATPEERAAFWKAWPTDPWAEQHADSLAIGTALDALAEAASGLPAVSTNAMAKFVLAPSFGRRRREVAEERDRRIHGVVWRQVETYDRLSHLDRERLACAEHGGYLLVLRTDFGPYERTGPAFEAILASIHAEPGSRPAP